MKQPFLSISRRIRSTPFTSRVQAGGVSAFTVYNHMLLATTFRSPIEDYWHLCENVQVWDVSCERQVQIQGPDASKLVQLMTPRDLSKAKDDQCFYLPLCDESGKMINDPIAIHVDSQTWWLSIADSDVKLWAKGLATGQGLDVTVTEPQVWPVAIQGPKAETLMQRVFGDDVASIKFFRYRRMNYKGHNFIVARSGWSKQGGFEVYVDNAELGQQMWDELFEKGQDLDVYHGCPNLIERMESGLLSFGNDMDYDHSPLQCGLDKYCHLDRGLESLSVPALTKQRDEGVPSRLVGIISKEMPEQPTAPSLRLDGKEIGEITSHSLAGKYDAWLCFALLDSAEIERLQASSEGFTVVTESGEYAAQMAELPFDFSSIELPLRPR